MTTAPTHVRVTMKDGRIFSGPLDHWDILEEFIALAVDHVQHPEVPEVFLLKEVASIVDVRSGERLL